MTVTDSTAIKSCGSDSHDVTVRDPSPGHCPMGLGRSLDLRWMETIAGGKRETDDQAVCGIAMRARITAWQLIVTALRR